MPHPVLEKAMLSINTMEIKGNINFSSLHFPVNYLFSDKHFTTYVIIRTKNLSYGEFLTHLDEEDKYDGYCLPHVWGSVSENKPAASCPTIPVSTNSEVWTHPIGAGSRPIIPIYIYIYILFHFILNFVFLNLKFPSSTFSWQLQNIIFVHLCLI